MIPAKNKVVEVLREVIYFPKGDNIINLKMVDDIELKENLIRFRLLFEKVEDEKNQILIDTATQMLKNAFGDIEVEIVAASQENALSKVKHIIAVATAMICFTFESAFSCEAATISTSMSPKAFFNICVAVSMRI